MESKIIAGADEAGRGCIIGPLVVAAVSATPEQEMELKKFGVRDSKELPHPKREELAKMIEDTAKDVIVFKVGPCKIDTFMKQGVNLNRIESMKFADAIKMLGPKVAYIDAPDTNLTRFNALMKKLVGDGIEIVAKHKADRDHPIVSAASIVAKVEREKDIAILKEKYGDFGTGYTSDEKTMEWLRKWIRKNKDFPEHLVRKSWSTHDVLKGEKEQKSLGEWFKRAIGK